MPTRLRDVQEGDWVVLVKTQFGESERRYLSRVQRRTKSQAIVDGFRFWVNRKLSYSSGRLAEDVPGDATSMKIEIPAEDDFKRVNRTEGSQ